MTGEVASGNCVNEALLAAKEAALATLKIFHCQAPMPERDWIFASFARDLHVLLPPDGLWLAMLAEVCSPGCGCKHGGKSVRKPPP